ncbi:condensation domain-containing protein [Saccharothrix texasensis]|uniref:Condensation domain-containing protein n=1 Tax=Saccharothrix texasensis TaxID=103734 RepID=A0A3N1HJ72_9PSEU|nr:condensation domain-containing protein [Saccharothrix texasensis]
MKAVPFTSHQGELIKGMLMTTLSEYRVRPGRLREWSLDEAPFREAASSAERGAPPSYNQEWHLRFVTSLTARDAWVPLWMGFRFDLAGPLDVEAFREALRTWVERHETLRTAFRATGAGTERFTVEPDAVSVRDVVVGDFASDDDLRACLEQRIDAATGAFSLPSHVVETVERADSTTVIVALDHAHTDGSSVMTAVAEWQELYAAAVAGRPVEHHDVGSYVDFGGVERAAAREVDADHPAVGHWARFIEAGGDRVLRFPLDLGVPDGEELPHAKQDVLLLDASEADAVEEACHDAGGGFLAGLLAALAIVAHQVTGEPVYRTVMPSSTRTRREWLSSMGWYIGVGPIEIDVRAAGSFLDVVPVAQRSAKTALRLSRVPMPRIAEILGIERELERRMPEVFPFVSFADMRVVPGVSRWPEWDARPLVRISTSGSKVNIWTHRTDEGFWLTARYPATETADVSVAGYVDRVREVLHSVAKTGDHLLRTEGETV